MLGERLRELRQQRGYSQEYLAQQVDVRNQQIWRYENGSQVASSEVVAKIAQVLNTSADYLLGLSDDPSPQSARGILSPEEEAVIAAWRRGDIIGALKIILEKA